MSYIAFQSLYCSFHFYLVYLYWLASDSHIFISYFRSDSQVKYVGYGRLRPSVVIAPPLLLIVLTGLYSIM